MKLNTFSTRPLWAPADAPGATPAPTTPDPAPAAPPVAADPADPAAPAAPDFSWVPEGFRNDAGVDADGFKAHYDELAAAHAQRQEAMAEVPADPTGYEWAAPEEVDFGDLELPEGFKVELKADDPTLAPLFGELGAFLHKHQIPKSAAGDLMGLLAKYEAAKYAPQYAGAKAEFASLGTAAEARVRNVERALDGKLPADLATALKGATRTAAGVKALEKLLSGSPMQTPPSLPNGANAENLTPLERLKLANQTRPLRRA